MIANDKGLLKQLRDILLPSDATFSPSSRSGGRILSMDVFGTVVTAGGLILQFLDACASYSDEAKSLKARFDWDLRVLRVIQDYFDRRRVQTANRRLSPEDAALLERTANYLADFVGKVQRSLGKIQRKGLLGNAFNRGMWIARREDLLEMEREIFEWTRRFDVRVLGLPPQLRTIIPAVSAEDAAEVPAVVRSNARLQEFVALASEAKQSRAGAMLLESPDTLASTITSMGDISSLPISYQGDELVFASRKVSSDTISGTKSFNDLKSDLGELAAALNCLDPAADIRLLKVEFYFYHEDTHQFLFAQKPPYPTVSMMTLDELIRGDPFPRVDIALNQRLKLAHKLAEAVFFLHTAGFLHKNITPSSVVVFQRSTLPSGEDPPFADDAYLMGFDLIRANEAKTSKEGTRKEGETPKSIWDFDVFQHGDRFKGKESRRYVKTYDIYSLGVVLLEIGFWAPLKGLVGVLAQKESSAWAKELQDASPRMDARVGERYRKLVTWCLTLTSDDVVKDVEFVQQVLDPLEDMVNALS